MSMPKLDELGMVDIHWLVQSGESIHDVKVGIYGITDGFEFAARTCNLHGALSEAGIVQHVENVARAVLGDIKWLILLDRVLTRDWNAS